MFTCDTLNTDEAENGGTCGDDCVYVSPLLHAWDAGVTTPFTRCYAIVLSKIIASWSVFFFSFHCILQMFIQMSSLSQFFTEIPTSEIPVGKGSEENFGMWRTVSMMWGHNLELCQAERKRPQLINGKCLTGIDLKMCVGHTRTEAIKDLEL